MSNYNVPLLLVVLWYVCQQHWKLKSSIILPPIDGTWELPWVLSRCKDKMWHNVFSFKFFEKLQDAFLRTTDKKLKLTGLRNLQMSKQQRKPLIPVRTYFGNCRFSKQALCGLTENFHLTFWTSLCCKHSCNVNCKGIYREQVPIFTML